MLMKKSVLMWTIALVCFFASQLLFTNTVRAEGATVDIVCDREEVCVGDEIVVSLMIKSNARLGGFEAFLSYNSNILEFKDADDGISGGDGVLRISDSDPVKRSKSRDYKITFKAVKVGGCQIAFEDRILIYDDETDDEMSVSATDLSLKVKAAVTASDECRLKNLKVSPGKLEPAFDAEVTEYRMTVDDSTEKLVISAIALDSKATVEVSGNGEFTTGTNKVIITVKAENSDVREYSIIVDKAEPGEIAREEEQKKKEEINELIESEFTVIGIGKDFCLTGRYNYTVTAVPSTKDIPNGYEGYTLELMGKKIPAYKEEGDADPKKVLLYVETGKDEHEFYEFDIAAKSMERISAFKTIEKESKEQPVKKEKGKDDTTVLYIIIVVLFVISALLALALISKSNGKKKKHRK